ncbi:MAG: uroporphyrinogen-III C-methyltransferase [Syntrophorhabdaceae bacterium]|nr:uroporphyrinogen-III C-methyltransferase [Syntrophorhabdaceae bacterium]
MGKVYLVGAGPGDVKLITVRGLDLIKKADVIIYDHLASRELLNFANGKAEVIYVGKQASKHELPQDEINSLLVRKALEKDIVVRLKGGDPFIFGRGGEEVEVLYERGIDFEIVPGVTSAISVPAYAGIPLTHRDYASSVAFITGHEDASKTESTIRWEPLAKGPDTLVFLMGIGNLKYIKEKLIEGGRNPDTPSSIIQWGTTPEQRTITGALKDIDIKAKEAGVKPPGIFVVGDVVKLRDKLKWFEKKPLFGKKIAVTRPKDQSFRLAELLTDKGGKVIYIPTIEIEPITPNKRLLDAIEGLHKYYSIIFTSVNGVSIFLENLYNSERDLRSLSGIKIIPIGEATATLLKSRGILPDIIPERFISEGIIDAIKDLDIKGKRFLLPRAEEARDVIVDFIEKKGGICDVIPIYRTKVPESTQRLEEAPDLITFTSSSTVTNFLQIYGKDRISGSYVASIGPITSETLKKNGIHVDIEAKRYDIVGLVDAIEAFFTEKGRTIH